MKKTKFHIFIYLFLWLISTAASAEPIAQDSNTAVIFVYHRIGEDEYPETNIRTEQFAAHIHELASEHYNVISLPQLINALKNKIKLPEHTVVLTFDGGHKSILENAVPLLQQYNFPFTLFISTNHIDRSTQDYMDWRTIKNLGRSKKVTIGLHPASYIRLHNETEAEITRQINTARQRFREELNTEPAFFAYPFGEFSNTYRTIIEKQGFEAAFGQQSGVTYSGADLLSLPRFPMTESFGGLDRFRLTAGALPLPVTDIEPKDPLLETLRPSIGFTVDPALKNQIENLSCFISGQDKPELKIIGQNRIELRPVKDFDSERIRLNCTLPLPLPSGETEPRWRWFGMQMLAPQNTTSSDEGFNNR